MKISKELAQKIVDKHGKSYSRNEVGLSVNCTDAAGKEFTIIQLNSGECAATDFDGRLTVAVEG